MKYNLMIDLETLSLSSTPVISSIGAVFFAPEAAEPITDEFYVNVKYDPSEIAKGFDIDLSTVAWWLTQSDEARKALSTPDPVCLTMALQMLSNFIHAKTGGNTDDLLVWGNGAAADNVWLSNAYKKLTFPVPWKYFNDRCYRTVRNMYPLEMGFAVEGLVSHNALDDAKYQALYLTEICRTYELELK